MLFDRKYEIELQLKESIEKIAKNISEDISIMEVCGTHTMSIHKYGIQNMLPKNIKLLSGPGCPVCVTPADYIDQAINLAKQNDTIMCTFGDMVRVPGTGESLEDARAQGAHVSIVYSPLDCIDIACRNRDKRVIFLAVGFETTAPVIGLAVEHARREKIDNFYILPGLKLLYPALRKLLNTKDININGLLCPGHITAITGEKSYDFIAEEYKIPCVVAGFGPADILAAINMLLLQIAAGDAKVENAYKRAGTVCGNPKASQLVNEVFMPCNDSWRGFGMIEGSGLQLCKDYESFQIKRAINTDNNTEEKTTTCRCGDIIKGLAQPNECKLFSKVCTPANPKGPCMVSGEGTCAAYYKYGKNSSPSPFSLQKKGK